MKIEDFSINFCFLMQLFSPILIIEIEIGGISVFNLNFYLYFCKIEVIDTLQVVHLLLYFRIMSGWAKRIQRLRADQMFNMLNVDVTGTKRE